MSLAFDKNRSPLRVRRARGRASVALAPVGASPRKRGQPQQQEIAVSIVRN